MKTDIKKHLQLSKLAKSASLTEQDIELIYDRSFRFTLLGYILLNAADIIIREAAKNAQLAQPMLVFEDKLRVGRAKDNLEGAIKQLEISSPMFDAILFEMGSTCYDSVRHNANELLRVVMNIYDKTVGDVDAFAKVEGLLDTMETKGVFTEGEREMFKLG